MTMELLAVVWIRILMAFQISADTKISVFGRWNLIFRDQFTNTGQGRVVFCGASLIEV